MDVRMQGHMPQTKVTELIDGESGSKLYLPYWLNIFQIYEEAAFLVQKDSNCMWVDNVIIIWIIFKSLSLDLPERLSSYNTYIVSIFKK